MSCRPRRLLSLVLVVALGGCYVSAQATTITITSTDGPGEGFNDTTPWTPVGGNTATTVGQARMNVFNRAAAMWAQRISSSVTITVNASFDPLTCSAGSATLGQAGSDHFFTISGHGNVLFPKALADKLTGSDSHPGEADITAQFNSSLDGSSSCLGGETFYYGFDHNNNPSTQVDILPVLLHELAHGLGFISLVDSNGNGDPNTVNGVTTTYFSIFDQFIYDESTNKFWPAMTVAQRKTSTTNNGFVVWNDANDIAANGGANVNSHATSYLTAGTTATGHVRLYAPTTWSDGSSISHWNTIGNTNPSPHLIMEHSYHTGIGTNADLTTCVMYDLGWTGSRCPDQDNRAPVALTESASTAENTAVAVTFSATDADGDSLTYSIASAPSPGTLSGSGSAQTYTPATGYTGADSFTYTANDPFEASAAATVSVTVTAPGSSSSSSSSSGGAAVTTPKKSGGGGVNGRGLLFWLLVTSLFAVRQRLRSLPQAM